MSPAQLWSMILPVLALSFGGIATIARYMRAELFEALSSGIHAGLRVQRV